MAGERLTEKLELIFDGLASGVPGAQYARYLELCEMREDVHIAAVAHQFRSGRTEIRPWLVRYLVDIQNERSIRTLIDLLRTSEEGIQDLLFDAVKQVPDKNSDKVDVLVETIGDRNRAVNLFAVRAMGHIRTPKCVVKIVRLLETEEDAEIRLAMLNALEDVRDTRGLEAGRRSLEDQDVEVVAQAVHLLAELGGRRDVKMLRKLAVHESPRVRRAVCDALGRNKEISPKALMSRILEDSDESVRGAAARALGSCQLESVAEALLTAAAEDASIAVRKAAGFVLSSMNRAAAAPALIRGLAKGSVARRRVALEHVGLRALHEAVSGVRRLLGDKDLKLRVAAAGALGRVGELRDIDDLEQLLGAEAPLAYASATAICRIVETGHLERMTRILDNHEDMPSELVQIFGRHLSLITRVHGLPDSLLNHVRTWLDRGNSNCAYLALRVLARCGDPGDLVRLEPFMDSGQDPKVRAEARDALSMILARHADEIHRDMVEGEVPDIPGVWSRLRTIEVPVEQRSGWITALALYLEVPDRVDELFEKFVESLNLVAEADEEEVPPEMRDVRVDSVVRTLGSAEDDTEVDIGDVAVPTGSTMDVRESDEEFMFDHDVQETPVVEVVRRGSARTWALLMSWIRRWPDALADLVRTLPDTEHDRVPALLALRHTARHRPLTSTEAEIIRDGLKSDSLVMRRIVLETIPWAQSSDLVDPLIEIALHSEPGDERNRARHLLSRTLKGAAL